MIWARKTFNHKRRETMKTMRLDVAEIGNLGCLAILGARQADEGSESVVTFLLIYVSDSLLAKYLKPTDNPDSLLSQIFFCQRQKPMRYFTWLNDQSLIFTRTVVDPFRDMHKYLHATATKLAKELRALKSLDVSEGEVRSGHHDTMTDEAQEPVTPINLLSTDNWQSDRRQIAEEQGPAEDEDDGQ